MPPPLVCAVCWGPVWDIESTTRRLWTVERVVFPNGSVMPDPASLWPIDVLEFKAVPCGHTVDRTEEREWVRRGKTSRPSSSQNGWTS